MTLCRHTAGELTSQLVSHPAIQSKKAASMLLHFCRCTRNANAVTPLSVWQQTSEDSPSLLWTLHSERTEWHDEQKTYHVSCHPPQLSIRRHWNKRTVMLTCSSHMSQNKTVRVIASTTRNLFWHKNAYFYLAWALTKCIWPCNLATLHQKSHFLNTLDPALHCLQSKHRLLIYDEIGRWVGQRQFRRI